MDIAWDIIRVGLGCFCGLLAVAYFWVTVRSFMFGTTAYEENRSVTYPGILRTAAGRMRPRAAIDHRRVSEGMSINLATGEIAPQGRLSTEALDDVIGRRF